MRFLLDESADARLVPWLRSMGHDVTSVAVEHPASLKDRGVLAIARSEKRILITDDRDLGELIFARGHPYTGVISLRLGDHVDLAIKQDRIAHVLENHADTLDGFLVVTLRHVRRHALP